MVHSRTTGTLRFTPVTGDNRTLVEGLSVSPDQSGFIEPVRECLREADGLALWRPAAIYRGDALVGFAMYGFFPDPSPGELWLDRLLIDWRHQGKGYGGQAVRALLEQLRREYGQDKVFLSVYETNTAAIRLYRKIGFRFNGGHDTKGEAIMEYVYDKERRRGYDCSADD